MRISKPAVAKILSNGSKTRVKYGSSLALTCIGAGFPTPTVTWKRGSNILAQSRGRAGILINYMTEEDEAVLVCEAFNGINKPSVDEIKVEVEEALTLKVLSPTLTFHPDCRLELKCLLNSSSEANVTWIFNNMKIEPRKSISMWNVDNLF